MNTINLRNKLNNLHGMVNNSSLYKYSALLDDIEYKLQNNIDTYNAYKDFNKLNKKYLIKIKKTNDILDKKIHFYLNTLNKNNKYYSLIETINNRLINITDDDIILRLDIYRILKDNI